MIPFLIIFTANILGIFTDPFEFQGDYGSDINPIREQVFEIVVSKEALAKGLTDSQVQAKMKSPEASNQEISAYREVLTQQGKQQDQQYGPTLSELTTPEILEALSKKQGELQNAGFTTEDLNKLLQFTSKYGDKKVFYYLRNNPSELLNLDKTLRDKAAREGKSFDLPILGSTAGLKGRHSLELKQDLMNAVFTEETLRLTKPQAPLQTAIQKLDPSYLKKFLGETADNRDLEAFLSPAGQAFFYWLYHSLNLQLVSQKPELIDQINQVKASFANSLGDPIARAKLFKEKLMAANAAVLFTQESDAIVAKSLTEDGLFLPVDKQNSQDGTLVFLKSDIWEPNLEVIPLENYEGYKEGKINLVLATHKETGQKFLLASGHGHSIKAEDGRQQITLIMEAYRRLAKNPENKNLQVIIGIDANTKSEQDVTLFKEHLDRLGLMATSVGPTTIKQRMVTAQHAKAAKMAIDEEDYLIILKPEQGGQFLITKPTVGFKKEKPDLNNPLPNIDNPSDHYPVGATLSPIQQTDEL